MARVVYKSNGGAIGDGVRITRISEGGQKLEVMVDAVAERFSEVVLRADDPVPDQIPDPEPQPDPTDGTPVTPSTFAAALAPGVTLVLASGDYGDMPDLPDGVSLFSDGEAVFTGYNLTGDNLAFGGITFRAHFDIVNDSARPFRHIGGTGVSFVGCTFEGNLMGDGLPTGRGPRFEGSKDVLFEGNTVRRFAKDVAFVSVIGGKIIGNDVGFMKSDGLVIGSDSRNILVEGNYIHDRIKPPPGVNTHGDMFVVQRGGDSHCQDISVIGNIIDLALGGAGQLIFFDAPSSAVPHENIVIDGNVIYGSHVNAMLIAAVNGLVVTNNCLLRVPRNPGDEPSHDNIDRPKVNIRDVAGLVLTGNVAPNFGPEVSAGPDNIELPESDYAAVFDVVQSVANGAPRNTWYFKSGALEGMGSPLMRR